MRIRSVKPEFWTDKRVASWDHFTRLFYIGLWSAADDHGRGSAEPSRLAAELFPYDLSRDTRETLAKVSGALARLSDDSRITVYEVDGEVFFEISKWAEHQRVDKPGKSRIPLPINDPATSSRDTRETLARHPSTEQGAGSRDQGSGIRAVVQRDDDSKLTDQQWIESLKSQKAYEGIDVDREVAKCKVWSDINKKQFSRRRVVNWLNRTEKPLNGVGKGKLKEIQEDLQPPML